MAQPARAAAAAGAPAPAAAAVAAPAAPVPAAAAAPAAAANPLIPRPAVMPEAYDGSDDWVEYHQYYDNCALVNGWADAQKAQFLGVRLRGAAQRFYVTLPVARRANWQHICADLAQRFAPAANVRLFKAQFKARRRQPGEDLAHIADDLRRMVVRAYPQMADHDREELVRDQFIECLTPLVLRLRLQENPPATVQAAVETALHLERIWGNEPSRGDLSRTTGQPDLAQPSLLVAATGAPIAAPGSLHAAQPAADPLSALAAALGSLNSKLDRLAMPSGGPRPPRDSRPLSQSSARTPSGCWNCGRRGHRRADCHLPPVPEYPRENAWKPPKSAPRYPSGNGH